MVLRKRSEGSKVGRFDGAMLAVDPVGREFPTIVEFLSRDRWEDGKPRKTGTVMLMVDDGRFKGWLHDRDDCFGCFVTGSTPHGLLEAIEEILRDGGGDWREDKR
jgi:hypothetical protein